MEEKGKEKEGNPMPIGVIVNCISVLAGGVIGSALGHVLPNSLKELRLKTKTPAKDMVAVVQTIYPKTT